MSKPEECGGFDFIWEHDIENIPVVKFIVFWKNGEKEKGFSSMDEAVEFANRKVEEVGRAYIAREVDGERNSPFHIV